MTVAVCFRCGVIKFGAFVACPECAAVPATEDDIAVSLAMTDHYFGRAELERMAAAVHAGTPPKLDPETHANLLRQVRATGLLDELRRLTDGGAAVPEED